MNDEIVVVLFLISTMYIGVFALSIPILIKLLILITSTIFLVLLFRIIKRKDREGL